MPRIVTASLAAAAIVAATIGPARAAGPWDAGTTVRTPAGSAVTVQVAYVGTALRCAAPDTLRVFEDGAAVCESAR